MEICTYLGALGDDPGDCLGEPAGDTHPLGGTGGGRSLRELVGDMRGEPVNGADLPLNCNDDE